MKHSGTLLTPRTPDEVFDLLANPERFAALLPDYESMTMQDATHFSLRIVIAFGEMSGHAELAMELAEAERPALVSYRGKGVVAGSALNLVLQFHMASTDAWTEINWQGEFSLEGGLAFMLAGVIESMGRQHFERMAERLRDTLNPVEPASDAVPAPAAGV